MSKPFPVIARTQMSKHDLSLRDLARMTGYSFGFLGRVISGSKHSKSLAFYEALAKALYISPFEICEYKILLLIDLLHSEPDRIDQISEKADLSKET